MAIASIRLAALIALGTGDTTVYTVPAGKRTIVKGVQTQNLGGAAARMTLKVFNGATELFQYATHCGAVGAVDDSDTRQIWLVMNAGETLKASANVGTFTVAVSGAELKV